MSRPTWARWVTRISLAIAVVALVLTIRDTGLATIGRYFKRIGWWWFAVVALEIAITSLDAIAIRSFMSPEQDRIRFGSALLSQLAGRSVNAVTPSGNLGEAVKVSVLTDHVSQSRAVATILLYNVVSFTVELAMVAVAVPFVVLLVPMPPSLRWLMIGAGALCGVLSVGLYVLVHMGVLSSVARLARRIRVPGLAWLRRKIWKKPDASHYLLSQARFEAWHGSLQGVDDKMRLSTGARMRDRVVGIGAVALSRATSMTLSLLILHAVGESITVAFVAAYTVGGFIIYMLSSLVPMGLGISEGGNWWLFRALGENPARGVTLVVARRVTLVMYAAIGLVLVAASETVRRARDGQPTVTERTAVLAPAPAPVTAAPVPVPTPVTPSPVIDAAD